MVNKSIANQLNVQILVLVLKSLQKSHPDLKFVSKFASIKCQSKLKMKLMNVEFSCFRCTSFLEFSVLCYFYRTVSFKFPTR